MRRLLVAAVAACLVGCSGAPAARRFEPPLQTQIPSSTIDPAVASTWPVPDDQLTPGLEASSCTYPRDTAERDVSASTKRAAARRYNYTGPAGLDYIEYDHRIPFALCGANTVANIWPEPVDGVKPSAFVHNRKDQLEAFAARQVRYKRWTLDYAQDVFRGDWREAWCRYLHYPGVDCNFPKKR